MDFVSATVPRAQPQIIKNIANRKVCFQHTAEALALLALPASAHKQAQIIRESPWALSVSCCAFNRRELLGSWHAKVSTPLAADVAWHAGCAERCARGRCKR